MARLKVLVVLPSFDRGGSESYCLRLIEFAREIEIDWHVTSGNLRNAQMEPIFSAAGATTHRVAPGRMRPGRAREFKRFLQEHRFDAVMTLTGLFGAEVLRLATSVRVPTRLAWHRRSSPAYSPTWPRRLYARWARWQLERSSSWILSNSETALDRFHGSGWRDQQKFRVLPNGVDSRRFFPRLEQKAEARRSLELPASATVVGHIGRFDPAKDHETLFSTIRIARESGVNAWLLCAGTGTDSERFRQRLNAHRVLECVRCLGVRSDVELLHAAMDVFVFPSVTEGQPNALIEAMLSGVRILASDIPPIREAVPKPLYGNLFSPGDAQAACRLLIREDAFDPARSEQARYWAIERYDPKRNFDKVLEILQS